MSKPKPCGLCGDFGCIEYPDPITLDLVGEACPLCNPYWVPPRRLTPPRSPEPEQGQRMQVTGTGIEGVPSNNETE